MKTRNLVSFVLVIATFALVGCSKDETKESIAGTTWIGAWLGQGYKLVEFTSNSEFYECYCDENGNLINPSDPYHGKNFGTYSLNGNDIDFITHDTYSAEFDRAVLKNNKTRMDIYLDHTGTSIAFQRK